MTEFFLILLGMTMGGALVWDEGYQWGVRAVERRAQRFEDVGDLGDL